MTSERKAPGPRFALIPAAVLLLGVLNVSIPYRSISPGPAYDVAQLLGIEGAETYPSSGTFFLTTVSLRSVTVATALRGWVDPVVDVIEVGRIVPPGVSDEEADRIQAEQMQQSQVTAAVASLSLLGYDIDLGGGGIRVESVMEGVPAAQVLRPGDVLVSVGGRPMCDVESLLATLLRLPVGAELPMRLRRDGEVVDVHVPTVGRPDNPAEPMIGIEVAGMPTEIQLPVQIRVDSRGVGGPSAGLMFGLAIVDRLEPEDLSAGRAIAGTGVISCGGAVTPVGGIGQKIVAAEEAGAELFLVPRQELREACDVAAEIQVVGVSTLAEAVRALRETAVAERWSCP